MKIRIIFGITIGSVLGYLYYKLIGCYSGTCSITSNPVNSTIYGAILVTLFIELIHEIRVSLLKIFHRQKKDHTNEELKEIEKMSDRINKFENPARIAELDPENTLIKAGYKDGMVLCDIGAGSGIFSFPAAQISSSNVFALEISDDMIEVLESRKLERNTQNLRIRKVETDRLPLEDQVCDMAIMVTVLHEIEDKNGMLKEIKRILKENGKFTVVEFHKEKTPMGPPTDHRISEELVMELCHDSGLKISEHYRLGDNFYCLVFQSI